MILCIAASFSSGVIGGASVYGTLDGCAAGEKLNRFGGEADEEDPDPDPDGLDSLGEDQESSGALGRSAKSSKAAPDDEAPAVAFGESDDGVGPFIGARSTSASGLSGSESAESCYGGRKNLRLDHFAFLLQIT